MRVLKKDLETIFRERAFGIPIYQRGYDWKKLNRETFWNDLVHHIDQDKNIFLGTIILNDNNGEDKLEEVDHFTRVSIVDGQQRFTTITILLVALKEAFKERLLEEEAKENPDATLVRKCNKNIELMLDKFLAIYDKDLDYVQPRLLGSNYKSKKIINGLAYVTHPDWNGGEFPSKAVKVRGKERKLTMEFNRFREVYTDFSVKLNEKNANGNYKKDVDELTGILQKLIRAEFIEIIVSDDFEAITLFETVNARGQELETSDLLKNNFFKEVHESKWNVVEKEWDIIVENSTGSGGISRLLKHFYVSRKGSGGSSPPQVLYENLKSYGKGKELQLLEEVREYSEFYKSINTEPMDEFFKDLKFDLYSNYFSEAKNRRHLFTSIELLRALSVTQPQPMIFSFFKTFHKLSHDGVSLKKEQHKKIKKFPLMFLRQIEHFHYVNNGVGERRANDTEILYQKTAKDFFDAKDLDTFKEVLRVFFSNLKKERDSQTTFVDNFCKKLSYDSGTTIKSMVHYSFQIIERHHKKMALFKDIFPNSKSTDVSLDHWADQNDTRDQNYEKIRKDILNDIDPFTQNCKIHSIGNLIPISGDLNSSLGNLAKKTPHEKSIELPKRPEFPEYIIQTLFLDNYKNDFKTWSKKNIDERNEELANTVFNIIDNEPANI